MPAAVSGTSNGGIGVRLDERVSTKIDDAFQVRAIRKNLEELVHHSPLIASTSGV